MKPLKSLFGSALILVFLLPVQLCHAWSEGGHHLIAAVTFSLLTEKEQAELIAVRQKHPRYAEDFVSPEKLTNKAEKIPSPPQHLCHADYLVNQKNSESYSGSLRPNKSNWQDRKPTEAKRSLSPEQITPIPKNSDTHRIHNGSGSCGLKLELKGNQVSN